MTLMNLVLSFLTGVGAPELDSSGPPVNMSLGFCFSATLPPFPSSFPISFILEMHKPFLWLGEVQKLDFRCFCPGGITVFGSCVLRVKLRCSRTSAQELVPTCPSSKGRPECERSREGLQAELNNNCSLETSETFSCSEGQISCWLFLSSTTAVG